MRNNVKIGSFTEQLTVNYLAGESETDMGGRVQNTLQHQINADVKILSSELKSKLGMNVEDMVIRCMMWNELPGRAKSVIWRGDVYRVTGSPEVDKQGRFIELKAAKTW